MKLLLIDDDDRRVFDGPVPHNVDEGTIISFGENLWAFSDERNSQPESTLVFRKVDTVRLSPNKPTTEEAIYGKEIG